MAQQEYRISWFNAGHEAVSWLFGKEKAEATAAALRKAGMTGVRVESVADVRKREGAA